MAQSGTTHTPECNAVLESWGASRKKISFMFHFLRQGDPYAIKTVDVKTVIVKYNHGLQKRLDTKTV
jgi:hypothetical protein